MSRRFRYEPDPATRHVPLTDSEVDQLLVNQGKVLRDEENAVHFLTRVQATLRAHKTGMSGLAGDVARMQADREVRSQPVARALEALSALTEQEKAQVLDASYLAEVSALRKAKEDAELARTAMLNESNRARFALASVMNDDTVPVDVRRRVSDAVSRLSSFQRPTQ